MKSLFQIAVRKEDGSVIQKNVLGTDVLNAFQKLQAAVTAPCEFLSASALGKAEIE